MRPGIASWGSPRDSDTPDIRRVLAHIDLRPEYADLIAGRYSPPKEAEPSMATRLTVINTVLLVIDTVDHLWHPIPLTKPPHWLRPESS